MICNTVKLIDNISFQSFSGDVRRSCHHDSANLSKMLIFTSRDVNDTLRSTKHGITFVKYYKVFKWVFFFSPLIDYVCQDRTHACLFINWLLCLKQINWVAGDVFGSGGPSADTHPTSSMSWYRRRHYCVTNIETIDTIHSEWIFPQQLQLAIDWWATGSGSACPVGQSSSSAVSHEGRINRFHSFFFKYFLASTSTRDVQQGRRGNGWQQRHRQGHRAGAVQGLPGGRLPHCQRWVCLVACRTRDLLNTKKKDS